MAKEVRAVKPWPEAAGIGKLDSRLISHAYWARTQVQNGHFLISPRYRQAAKRMCARKFLTRVPPSERPGDVYFGDADDWIIVKLTPKNWKNLQCAVVDGGGALSDN